MDLVETDLTIPGISELLPLNPVSEIRSKIYHITDLPSIERYCPTPTKGGLGKTQGTKGMFRGMQCDSKWEAAWYIYQSDILGNFVTRNTKESFRYTNAEGNEAKFYPDFKMNGQFHEIKGIYRPDDILKKEATNGIVVFWGKEEMKPILKKVKAFNPKWEEEFVESGIIHAKYGK